MGTNMECIICKNPIEEKRTPEGKVYWDQGNNAEPVAEGRCCDVCNADIVIPTRFMEMSSE
tara:strand:+ start:129 stop:311 length:183 start_codon:yes stop_codon:yes gene_type:complete